jgi:choline dehydrogenase-like flavoprotein
MTATKSAASTTATIDHPDVIIVGSGCGGGTAAHALTARGFSVVVFEKGPKKTAEDFLPLDELHFLTRKGMIPTADTAPQIYAGVDGKQRIAVERWWEAEMVGGSTMIWDANFPRYTREDLEVLTYLKDVPKDASMVNWPWTYDQFQPYFEQAEHLWGVSGKTRQHDHHARQEPTRDGYEFAMPPLRPHASTEFLMQAFGKAGMKPYLGARAINSQTFDSRPACSFCGYNQFFGCAVNSRASSVNTVLARALATGRCDLRPGHCVTRLVHDNGRVRGVMYKTEHGGPEQFLGASTVFVSVQTIQSARMFLLSEIPDPNKLIGRYLTYHTKGNAELVFKTKPVWDAGAAYQPRTAIGSLQLRDLYVIDDPTTPLTKGGKFSIYDPYTCTTPIRQVKGASLGKDRPNVWGTELVDYLRELRSNGGVSFSFTGEAMSLYDNRVELDDVVKDPWGLPVAKTYYRHHEYDRRLAEYALDRVIQVMTDAGGELRRYEAQSEANPGYGHVHGALRAGTDPGASVLDADCQSHTVKGLYVLDASFMPTAGAANPSLTLIANALRVCERVSLS